MSNHTKISCPRCGIDHPYFSCDYEHGSPTPGSSSNFDTTGIFLSELVQELKEVKTVLADIATELRKFNKKKVLED